MNDRPTRHRDDGLTLVEIIIAMMVGTIVLALVSMILMNTLQTQGQVVSQTSATTRGQLVATTLERSMRNALAFEVSADGTTLRVRTSLEGALVCQGFRLTNSGASFIQTAGALPDATTWPLWQDALRPDGTAPFMSRSLDGIDYSYLIPTDASPVRVTSGISPRNPTGVSAPCW